MAKTKKTEEAAPARTPLWPQPIPVIGLTGEYASGKTLFGLTIAPGKDTLVYDTEKSSVSYTALGFDRIDVPAEMLKKYGDRTRHPNGYKPVDVFVWWRDHVRTIPAGRYRVVMLDTVGEIESGLADYVLAHPAEFGRTAAQYARASGIMWADVKEHWKTLLADLASRCETFVFTSHLKQVWAGSTPTGKKAPKGKSTLEELASLYLWMERKPNAKGEVPAKPSAIVRKSRLAHLRVTESGEVLTLPALPPRIPEATPAAIRRYQQTPPDYGALTADELAPPEVLSEDERLKLRTRAAEAEAEAERLRAERTAGKPTSAKEAKAKAAPPQPAERAEPPAPPISDARTDLMSRLGRLREALFTLDEPEDPAVAWAAILKPYGAERAADLSLPDLLKLCDKLATLVSAEEMQAALDAGAGDETDDG